MPVGSWLLAVTVCCIGDPVKAAIVGSTPGQVWVKDHHSVLLTLSFQVHQMPISLPIHDSCSLRAFFALTHPTFCSTINYAAEQVFRYDSLLYLKPFAYYILYKKKSTVQIAIKIQV